MSFTRVEVISDTPEWLEERRKSLGASEVAAVMGLSPWNTPLDIYKSKQGIDTDFDPVLSMIGHESEAIVARWIEEYSGIGLKLESGFMARSTLQPYLHASFDRIVQEPEFLTIQIKTAHQYSAHKWDEGIPTDIRIQVQAEMFVAGTHKALVVVWIGGRQFRSFWEQYDAQFVDDHMLPAVAEFEAMVREGKPPIPRSLAEVNTEWPSENREVEATSEVFDWIGQRALLLSDAKSMEDEAKALQLKIAQFMETADTLTFNGKRVMTYKTQKGRESFDAAAFKAEHADLAAQYTKQGADFRVMRTMKGALDNE